MSGFGDFLGFMYLLWFAITIGVTYDAHTHGKSAVKWFFITGMLGIFGLIWYMFSNSKANTYPTYKVYGPIKDTETNEEKTVRITVKAESPSSAITRFKAECSDSGYIPQEDPMVEVVTN